MSLLLILCLLILFCTGRLKLGGLCPLAMYAVALSLLYNNALVTGHVWGWDIQNEVFQANLVLEQGAWDPSFDFEVNAMLSIVLLAPMASLVSGMTVVGLYKILYPALFALVPTILFVAYERLTDRATALVGAAFFVTVVVFHTEMLALARQEIAEVFLALLVLLLTIPAVRDHRFTLLAVLGVLGLVVSHYGVAYLFIFFPVAAAIVRGAALSWRNPVWRPVSSAAFAAFGCVFLFLWFSNVASSTILINVVTIAKAIVTKLATHLLDPGQVEGLRLITRNEGSVVRTLSKVLWILSSGLITLGLLSLVLRERRPRFPAEYRVFSILAFGMLVGSVVLPNFAGAFRTTRLYHFSLFFLAPYFAIGIGYATAAVVATFRGVRPSGRPSAWRGVAAAGLAVLFVFDTGLAHTAAGEEPPTLSLDAEFDYPRFTDEEVAAADWMREHAPAAEVYGDWFRYLLLRSKYSPHQVVLYEGDVEIGEEGALLFEGRRNVQEEIFLMRRIDPEYGEHRVDVPLEDAIPEGSWVYANGFARVRHLSSMGGGAA